MNSKIKMGVTLGALAGALLVKKPVFAGTIYDELRSLTQQELSLYASHPAEAIKVQAAANEAEQSTAKCWSAYTRWQGNGDAYRHAYWSALMTRRISRDFAYDAGLAHEGLARGYNFSSLSADTKMDVQNNYFGRIIGTDLSGQSDFNVQCAINDNVRGGNLKRIRTYTSSSSKCDKVIAGVKTKYVGYYVVTNSGGYLK